MDGRQVHFEVFACKRAGGGWSLELATEDREAATTAAQAIMNEHRALAVKVTKETLDPETRGFRSATILTLGDANAPPPKKVKENLEPLCVSPQDLYSMHARSRIARLLEGWLGRYRVTVFELLHRPDLVEKLESSGTDLQHALQKISVPEAQDRGVSVHELMRTFQALVERAIERLLKDAKKGVFPNLAKESFAAAAERLVREPERGYLLGGAVAVSLADSATWAEKVSRILDLADSAPPSGPSRALALSALEQPLSEILGSKVGQDDLFGHDLDLGGGLAAMTRLAAAEVVDPLIAANASVAKIMPKLSPEAERLAGWLICDEFAGVRSEIGKRVLRELNGPRRLRPADPEGEIDVLRGLAMALTAAAGRMLPIEDVQEAFGARSKTLITGDFVDSLLGKNRTPLGEAEAVLWLVENVIGAANKRQAGRYLMGVITALRFETEMRHGSESPTSRLAALARLQRAVGRCGLVPEDYEPLQRCFGELGGHIEAGGKMTGLIARGPGSALGRLTQLLRMASGETAPLGPAADRARAEALRLVRLDDTRTELAASPEHMAQVRDLLATVNKAA